jgi:hypothetical protein
MRRVKQLLTMHFGAGASTRAIGRERGIAPSTVREYLGRAASSESASNLDGQQFTVPDVRAASPIGSSSPSASDGGQDRPGTYFS